MFYQQDILSIIFYKLHAILLREEDLTNFPKSESDQTNFFGNSLLVESKYFQYLLVKKMKNYLITLIANCRLSSPFFSSQYFGCALQPLSKVHCIK